MQEMRKDFRKSALRVREVWRFPGHHSPHHWGVYKVAWALGERYLRNHSFAQAIRAKSREMRRAYDEVLAELSGKGSCKEWEGPRVGRWSMSAKCAILRAAGCRIMVVRTLRVRVVPVRLRAPRQERAAVPFSQRAILDPKKVEVF